MSEPREWYLIGKDVISGNSIAEPNPPRGIGNIIVVEKTAYDELKKENEHLKQRLAEVLKKQTKPN